MLIEHLTESITGCVGVSGAGLSYVVFLQDSTSRSATDDEILSAAKAEKLELIRAEARAQIEAVYPAWRQSNAALGLLPQAYVATMITDIAAVIAASNAAEDAVDAVTLVAGLAAALAAIDGVTPVWP